MRVLTVIFVLLCFDYNVFSQKVANKKRDTVNFDHHLELASFPRGYDIKKDTARHLRPTKKIQGALCVIDDIIVPDSAYLITYNSKRDDIFLVSVLVDSNAIKVYGKSGSGGVILITTKQYAKKQYQNKLSSFSREYESYLKSHNGKDDDIQYVVHSDPLEKLEVLNFLYKLPPEKIIGVTFTERPMPNGKGTQKTVIIDTKVGE